MYDLAEATKKLAQIDADFVRRGVPLQYRPLRAFNILAADPDKRDSASDLLFDTISRWFISKYGDKVIWDGVIGEQPVMIRERVYSVSLMFQGASRIVSLNDQLRDVPEEVRDSLSEDEFKKISYILLCAFESYSAICNLEMRPSLLKEEQWELVRRGKFDLKAASSLLKDEDTQGSITHSHQAVEKFMKAVMLGYGFDKDTLRREYSHKLRKLYQTLRAHHEKFENLQRPAYALDDLLGSMNIRYAEVPRSMLHALSGFDAARSICSFLAKQWQLDADRGCPDVDLEPGRFYRDYAGRCFRCIRIKTDEKGRQLTEMFIVNDVESLKFAAIATLRGKPGYNYVELTDEALLRNLENRFQALWSQTPAS